MKQWILKIKKQKILFLIIFLILIFVTIMVGSNYIKKIEKQSENKNNEDQLAEPKIESNNQQVTTEGAEEPSVKLMSEEEAKNYFNATEIVFNNLPQSVILNTKEFGDADRESFNIEFWTEANCPFEGNEYGYEVPSNMIFSNCEKGEKGSHGGCATCEMSKIKLVPCWQKTDCSINEFSRVDPNYSSKKIIEGSIGGFYIDTNFDPEFTTYWQDSIQEVIDFINILDLESVSRGIYIKEELQNKFSGAKLENFEINSGKLDSEYNGNTTIITFNDETGSFILILNDNKAKRLLFLDQWHKHSVSFKNNPLAVDDKFFFQMSVGGAGGTCTGFYGEEYVCSIKNSDFICYGVGSFGGGASCSLGDTFIKDESKDVDNDNKNEIIVKHIADFPYDLFNHTENNCFEKEYFEEIYRLNENNNLELVSSRPIDGEIKKIIKDY